MELWMWIIGIALAIGGFLFGMFLGGGSSEGDSGQAKAKTRALESELSSVKEEFTQYRDEVSTHFRTTANLVHQMTNSYKNVYEHLATGSQQLCSGEVMLELDEAPRLASGSAAGGNNGGGQSVEGETTSAETARAAKGGEDEARTAMH